MFDLLLPFVPTLASWAMSDETDAEVAEHKGAGDHQAAWESVQTERREDDPTNQDTDLAAAEHYLYARHSAMEAGDNYGPLGAIGDSMLTSALTVGYDGAKMAGFGVKDYVSEDAGDWLLETLVENTSGATDTLPSRPTLNSMASGIAGANEGMGESIWNWISE
jgi:hypothetical protein